MPEKEQAPQRTPPSEPDRTEAARQAVQEYIDDQRAVIKQLRRKMN